METFARRGGRVTPAPDPGGRPATVAEDRRYARAAMWLVAALTVFRLFYCTTLELAGDEAYYWLWSKHPDYGYYSKGPGIAWAIRAGTALLGDTALGIRSPAVLLSALSFGLLFVIARRLYGARAAFWTVALGQTVPLFLSGSLLMTIDPLSVFFWLAAAAAFLEAAETDRFAAWTATGLCVALGVLCKFTNLAELASFAAVLAWVPRWRPRFRSPGLWWMILLAAAGLVPPLLWNAHHGWVTARHLAERGAIDQPFRGDVKELLKFVGSQAAVLSPVYFAGLVGALARREWRGPRAETVRVLLGFIAPLPLLYMGVSLNGESEANWTAPALALCPVYLAGSWLAWADVRPARRRTLAWIVGVHAVLAVTLHAVFAGPWIFGSDRFNRIGGAADLARQTADLQARHGATFLLGGGYQMAALLSFYGAGHPETFIADRGRIENQFSFWPGYRGRFTGQSALLISRTGHVPPELRAQFRSVEPLGTLEPVYRGRRMRPQHVTLLRELRPAKAGRKKPPIPGE
ncbi:MAG: glycosyltransferase family 39 protein [Verrucomicrobia bacterium]|nr:glycosyltransferase family 39 protein [Verrucomicrobiota bacterium]